MTPAPHGDRALVPKRTNARGSGQRIAGISVNGRREQGGLLGTILTLQGRLERRLVADGRQQSLFRQGSCGVNHIAVHWQPPDEIAKQVNRPQRSPTRRLLRNHLTIYLVRHHAYLKAAEREG